MLVWMPSDSIRRRSLSRTAALVIAATILATTGLVARPGRVAAVPTIIGIVPRISFYGRGYGHGVGMSQYGARGRALAGQTSAAILAHYYAGTTPGTRDPATQVRVLVLTGFAATTARPATIVGRAGAWTIDGIGKTFPSDARLTLAPTAAGATTYSLKVSSSAGAVLHAATVGGTLIVRPGAGASRLQLVSKPSLFDTYRGVLRVRLTKTVMVVNDVGIDAYLRGVVPVEMPAGWPVEALRTQAIAARSYALARIHPSTGSYDLYDDTRSQVYRGSKAEVAATDAVVAATAGAVLLSGSSVINAMYHSADGGATENNENVFVSASGRIVAGPVSYLRGSSDRAPDGSSFDRTSPWATWKTASYTRTELGAFFATDSRTNVGSLNRLDLSKRGVSGRLISVTLFGSLGSKTVSGDVFRAVFNAASPLADPPLRGTLFGVRPIP